MINYDDIKTYVDAGKTPAEIVAILQADIRTQKPIDLGQLLFVLNNRGMLVRLIRPADTGEKWSGTVVNMILYVNDQGDPQQAAAVNQWFSHITNDRNQKFDTTDPAFAGLVSLMKSTFGGQPGMPSVADFDAIFELGGGLKFASVTESEVQKVISQHNAEESRQLAIARLNNAVDAVSQAITDDPTISNADMVAAFGGALS